MIIVHHHSVKILIFNWKDIRHPAAGGAEILIFELARRLVRDRHTVTIFARAFPGCQPTDSIEGITVVRRGQKLSVYLHAFLYYKRLTVKPDLVIDSVNTLPWFTPWYVSASQRVVFVYQLAREVLHYHMPPFLSGLAYRSERLLYMPYYSTHTLCISNSTKSDLISIGLPVSHVHPFPLGVDHKKYYPGAAKEPFPLFVFVGRLVKMKRVDVCIDAMKIVAAHHPQAQFSIIGQGPERRALKVHVQRLGLNKNVHLLSSSHPSALGNDKQKIQLLQKAWALLLPSVKEGWGMVVTEAAACGTPALVSNVSGLCDSVIHGQTGLIGSASPPPQELARMMLDIADQPALRKRLAHGALQWSQEFDWEKSYQNVVNILARLGFKTQ